MAKSVLPYEEMIGFIIPCGSIQLIEIIENCEICFKYSLLWS